MEVAAVVQRLLRILMYTFIKWQKYIFLYSIEALHFVSITFSLLDIPNRRSILKGHQLEMLKFLRLLFFKSILYFAKLSEVDNKWYTVFVPLSMAFQAKNKEKTSFRKIRFLLPFEKKNARVFSAIERKHLPFFSSWKMPTFFQTTFSFMPFFFLETFESRFFAKDNSKNISLFSQRV